MADPDPAAAPPADLPPRGSRRARAVAWIGRARKPVIAVAAVGTVLSGLVGYWTAWRAVHGGGAATVAASSPSGPQKTVAVLPFTNVGDDRANEPFADGVTEELIDVLSRVQGLRVTPRISSFSLKGKSVPAAEAAHQLGVSYLVDGSVRRAGERVRISAQLVSAADGRVVWSRTFDREFKDALAAQAEIAIGIASSLVPSLDPSAGMYSSGTNSPEAWQAYLEAKQLPIEQREAAYLRVLAIDPKFVRIHTELAIDFLQMGFRGKLPRPAAHDKMIQHLEQALRVDPRDDSAWGLMGAAARLVDDVDELRRVVRRAIEADPNGSSGRGWLAELKLLDGDSSAALPLYKQLAEHLPLVDFARIHYVESLRFAHRPLQALEAAEQALALDPESRWGQDQKVRCLLLLGRRDEALALARERSMHTILLRFGTPEDQVALSQRQDLNPHAVAWQQFVAGRADAVVEHLEVDHSSDLQERARVLFEPEYDPVRELPSFKAWLAKHRLTEGHERAQAWRAANPVPRN
jgi:adenylate cyclase